MKTYTNNNRKDSPLTRYLSLFASVVALVLWLMPTAVAAAAPKWTLSVNAIPTGFTPGASGNATEGPLYRLLAKNTGDAPTTGTYTLTDILPAELTPGVEISGKDGKGNALTCETNGQTVTCTGVEAVEVGEQVEVRIPVNVAPDSAGREVLNEAKVEGGGAIAEVVTTTTAIGAPAWKLTAVRLPTNFIPGVEPNVVGPFYFPLATNVGGAPTSGPITLEATLPVGLTPVDKIGLSSDPLSPVPTCSIAGQTVTCETTTPVQPGHWIGLKVSVAVASEASGTPSAGASVSGGGAPEATIASTTIISPDPVPFDFLAFDAPLVNADGSAATQAGSHPDRLTVDVDFPAEKVGETSLSSTGHPRDIHFELPPGMVVNPQATPVRCTEAQLTGANCPRASQVGTVSVMTLTAGPNPVVQPLFNMVPPPGAPASLGFDAVGVGIYTHLLGGVRNDDRYQLYADADDVLARGASPILSVQTQLWGHPTSAVHDQIRECSTFGNCPVDPAERSDIAFLTMPSECSGEPLKTTIQANTWEEPKVFKEASYDSADLGGSPVSVSGCNQVDFKPTIRSQPTTNLADSSSGLEFDLHQPQDFDVDSLSTAPVRDATVTLPPGMVVNPSQADGLGACTVAQVGLTSAIGETPIRFSKPADDCPNSAKLASVEVETPLLDEPLPGAIYLAEPFENPFDSLIAVYLTIDDPKTSTVAKLAGRVQLNQTTGQISTTFAENPQLPIEDFAVRFFAGPRAPFRTPATCATHTTVVDLTPWSAPEGADAHPSDSFVTTGAPAGGPCPATETEVPHRPAFTAGTVELRAGAYSPFVLRISRPDDTQYLSGVKATLPPGLIGKLAGVGTCSEAEIAVAEARNAPEEGALELANPSCPVSSEVGSVDVSAGAGISPLYVHGRAYLAGPYKGAPVSVVIITPAVAGPFDLGTVVVRSALRVDPRTAQIEAVSDPLPTIIEGIPLDVRSINLRMGRPQFTLNPTSCDPMAIEGVLASVLGQSATLQSPFQVGGCSDLGFKPKLALRLKGGTRRGDNPKLIANLRARPGDSNIGRAQVTLPGSAFLDQAHIRTICTRVQFAADQCPKGSVYGKASAITPLLDYPLTGLVYLRSSDNPLPDLVADLRGPSHQPLRVELVGRTDAVKGALRNTFDVVPDAPVSSFHLELFGGKRGLVVNSQNLCAKRHRATVKFDAHNGKVRDFRPVVKSNCRGKEAKRGKGNKRR